MLGHVTAGNINATDTVGDCEAFVDGHGVRDSIACVEDNAGGTARGVERENGLNGGVECRDVERFEEDLGCRVAVGAGVEGGFCQQNRMLCAGSANCALYCVVTSLH